MPRRAHRPPRPRSPASASPIPMPAPSPRRPRPTAPVGCVPGPPSAGRAGRARPSGVRPAAPRRRCPRRPPSAPTGRRWWNRFRPPHPVHATAGPARPARRPARWHPAVVGAPQSPCSSDYSPALSPHRLKRPAAGYPGQVKGVIDVVTGGLKRRIHRRHSAQSVAVSLASRFVVKNIVRAWAFRPDLAWPLGSVDRFAGLVPYRPTVRIERLRLGHCVAERIQTAEASAQRAILYLHGGAFLTCGLNTHRSLAARLSADADACVLNVDYRMLPSHRISDAIEDALNGLRWLFRRGYDPDKIVGAEIGRAHV